MELKNEYSLLSRKQKKMINELNNVFLLVYGKSVGDFLKEKSTLEEEIKCLDNNLTTKINEQKTKIEQLEKRISDYEEVVKRLSKSYDSYSFNNLSQNDLFMEMWTGKTKEEREKEERGNA